MSAPERIWAARGLYDCAPGQRYPNTVEYIRADLPPTLSACLAHPEVKALVEAVEQLGLRNLVAGWNGEGREKPYPPHPETLIAMIKTTCGTVYAVDAALARIKDAAP